MNEHEKALPAGGPAKPTQNAVKIYVISSRERLLLPLAFCFCLLLVNTLLWSGPTAGLTASVCVWYGLLGLYLGRTLLNTWESRVLLAVNLGLSLLSPDLDFNSFKLGSFAPVFYLNGVLGSVAVLELLRWLEARISLRPLIWCGRHSMFLMATHLPWQIAPELVMLGKRFYLAQTPTAPYFLMMLAEFAVLMLIEAALVWCKEKVKAAMTGRWGKERPICKAVKYL